MARSRQHKTKRHNDREVEKLQRLPKDAKIHKRPLMRPPIPSPFASSEQQKVVYVSTKTPFMSAFKRVQKLLSYVEKRDVQSILSKQTKHGIVRLNVDVEERISEAVLIKANGKAIEKALGLALFLQGMDRYAVKVGTESVEAIDDVTIDAPAEGEEEMDEARIRKTSMIVIEVMLK